MSNPLYTIRNYQPTDFDKYLRLNIEAENLEPRGRHISAQALAEDLSKPNYSPEQDLFLAEIDKNLIGYMNINPELKIRRVILDCWVHPDHRRRGLATKLLGYATKRAKELGAKTGRVNIPEKDVIAKKVLPRFGFRLVRQFLELRLDIAKAHWQSIDQTSLEYRQFKRGGEDKLAQLQNRCFAGSWGYNPNTVEEIIYRTTLSNCSPEDIILACDGDKPIGYCWSIIEPEENTPSGKSKGRIYMLGVDPGYRGKGIGKLILLAGLSCLKNKEIRIAKLTVDSENKAACALYQSVGFEICSTTLWYERALGKPK